MRLALLVFTTGCAGSGLDAGLRGSDADDQAVTGGTVSSSVLTDQVSIQSNGAHFCGGTIIDARHVLTAAHCFDAVVPGLTVEAGSTTIGQGTTFGVRSVVVHPRYDPTTIDYDVAVLEIDGDLGIVGTQALVFEPNEAMDVSVGTPARISGWGAEVQEGTASPWLEVAQVSLFGHAECQAAFAGTGWTVTDQMVCVDTTSGVTSCTGDSGGGVIVDHAGYAAVMGVVSLGACGSTVLPNVAASVPALSAWIRSQAPGSVGTSEIPTPVFGGVIPLGSGVRTYLAPGSIQAIIRVREPTTFGIHTTGGSGASFSLGTMWSEPYQIGDEVIRATAEPGDYPFVLYANEPVEFVLTPVP